MDTFSSCQGCSKRAKGCHSHCLDYLSERILDAAYNQKERKEMNEKRVRIESEQNRISRINNKKAGKQR